MKRPLVICWIALGFIFVTWVLAQILRSNVPWKSEGAASWAQAFGSLIGIGIAIAVPEWQRRRASQTERKQRRIEGIALVIVAFERLEGAADLLCDIRDTAVVQNPAAIRAADAAINAFPAHMMGDPVGILQMSHVSGILSGAIGVADELAKARLDPEVSPEDFGKKASDCAENLRAFATQLREKTWDLVEHYDFPSGDIVPLRSAR